MGYYFCGILTGILFCVMVLLVRCAVWFEITHPEEDYWHRSAMRRDGPEKVSWLKPAGDLEDAQHQSCSQEEVNGQKEEASQSRSAEMKVLLLPVMLVLFMLRVLVKISIELSSVIVGGLILIVFGCIIYAIVQQMWPSMCILIAMEAVLIMVTAGAGILDLLLEEASINLGLLMRS